LCCYPSSLHTKCHRVNCINANSARDPSRSSRHSASIRGTRDILLPSLNVMPARHCNGLLVQAIAEIPSAVKTKLGICRLLKCNCIQNASFALSLYSLPLWPRFQIRRTSGSSGKHFFFLFRRFYVQVLVLAGSLRTSSLCVGRFQHSISD
jgi:hypothetical protein